MKFVTQLFSRHPPEIAEFHPETFIREWGNGHGFRLADALTGVVCFGGTGSGKSSGIAKHLGYGYLAAGFGGVVLCAKVEEKKQWEKWAEETGRSDDLVIVDSSGRQRFNFLEWEASRPEASGGLAINIVSIFDEVLGAIARSTGKSEKGGGENKFWEDSVHHLMMNLVDLTLFAGVQVALPLLRSILISAPQSLAQLEDPTWQERSTCAAVLREAEKAVANADPDKLAHWEECRAFWCQEFPLLAEKPRSIITMSFAMLARPLVTQPMRRLFCADTNIKPEDTFAGKIIVVDLPVQDFRVAGRIASIIWKYCFQVSVMRRTPPANGHLRPVFLWADEAQNFVTSFDAEYQAVARSAAGCTVYLTQNRESFIRILGSEESVDSLLGNLQAKFFCQQSSTETNDWAAKLFGERWLGITTTNVGRNTSERVDQGGGHSSGISRADQRRYYVEPARFTTLKRGGATNNFQVEAIVYNGGHIFPGPDGEPLPYRLLTLNQR